MALEALPRRDCTSCPLIKASRVIFKEVANIYHQNHKKHNSTPSEKTTEI
jgi:hypothetical protein